MKEGFWLWNLYSCLVSEGQRLLVILECPSQASPRLWLLCPIVLNESWGDGGLATVNSCRSVGCEVCVGLELWLLMLLVCTNAYLRVSFVLLIFGPHPEVLSASFWLCDYGSTTATSPQESFYFGGHLKGTSNAILVRCIRKFRIEKGWVRLQDEAGMKPEHDFQRWEDMRINSGCNYTREWCKFSTKTKLIKMSVQHLLFSGKARMLSASPELCRKLLSRSVCL